MNNTQSPAILMERMEKKLNHMLLGKQETVRSILICLLAGGNLLIEDVPGVGKTLLATSIARLMGGQFNRIQFTSDVMPADIIGGMLLDLQAGGLVYREGPIMANVVLADELNRASTKTQSALLEALEERSVSIEGVTYRLPDPFIFIATQNPYQYEGTNHLLEAQLDRFMMQVSIGYPTRETEQELLTQFAQSFRPEIDHIRPVMTLEEWKKLQSNICQVFVHSDLISYMTEVAANSREDSSLRIGISPRALRDWMRTAQAAAYIHGRGFIVPDDLLTYGPLTLAHRIQYYGYHQSQHEKLNYIQQLLQQVPFARGLKERVR